jgi:radical SAM enzyme (TIGR01210 family)
VISPPYPQTPAERDRWILARRPPRAPADPWKPAAFFVEDERGESGQVAAVATIFLTNRECPWRCLMCDLWRQMLTEPVPPGAIPAQIDHALSRLPAARTVKLYNSGSFFDQRAIPREEHGAIATRVAAFERVVVECHPSLIDGRVVRFARQLQGTLEVAMGLETVHPEVLPRLNKRMTLEQFSGAAEFLRQQAIPFRVFILVKPPFLNDETAAVDWAVRSLEFAFDCGATAAVLIPTRPGNGAMDDLQARDEFSPPKLATLERAANAGVALGRGRVFADVWDLERFSDCAACFPRRVARLTAMNHTQQIIPPVRCEVCSQ